MFVNQRPDVARDARRPGAARKDDVSALDIGANVAKPMLLERRTQGGHGQAVALDEIHAPEQHDVTRHGDNKDAFKAAAA
jgi:hypothetical protein